MKKRFLFLIIFSVLFFLFFPVKQANAQVSCFQMTVDGDPNNPQLPSPGQAISVIVTAENRCLSSIGAGYKMEVVWQLRNPEGTSIMTQYFTPKIDSYTLVGDVPPGLSATHTFTTSIGSGETCSTYGSKVTVVAFLSAPTEKSSDFIYNVSPDLSGIGAKLYGNVTDNTGNLTSANVIISPADYSAGSYSAGGGFYEFNGLDCSHNHTVTATSTINGQTTTKTVYAAYAGSPSLCNGEGARVDLSFTKPDCNATPSCTGTCTTTQSNTCSNNGTWSGGCVFTTYNSSTNCTQTTAPNSCSVDNCDSGYKCDSFGTCVSTSCPSMTCRYLETVSTSTCSSGQQWVKGTGCTGDNCVGCNYVNATCSTTQCYVPGATPPPTASPTTPPSYDQPCGSCPNGGGGCPSGQTTCYAGGINMGCRPLYSCFVDAGNVCQWDPTNCTNNPPGGDGAYGQCFQMDIVPYWGLCNTYYKLYGDPSTYPSDCLGTEPPTQAGKNCLSEVRYEYACDGGSCHLPDPPYPGGNCTPEKNCNGDIACPATPVTSCSCDPQCDSQAFMSFDPASPQLNQPFTIKVTSTIGYQNVKLTGTDPTGSTTFFNYAGVSGGSGGNPYIWKWTVQKALGGKYSFVFGVNQGTACGGNSSDGVGTNYNCATQTFTLNVLPWIQVVGGDVHSNSGINAPGGP